MGRGVLRLPRVGVCLTGLAMASIVVLFAGSVPAFGTTLLNDPNIGFCPSTTITKAACTTPTGFGGHTISVGSSSFGMLSNGAPSSGSPWYLLVAVPEMTAGSVTAPTITSGSFTQIGTTADAGAFAQTTPSGTDIYDFASAFDGGLKGDGSMNAPNLFCDGAPGFNPPTTTCSSSNEIKAYGKLPTYFEIFVYTFGPGITGNTGYEFFSSPDLIGGTYLAGLGQGSNGNQPFQTPFTTTGLVSGPVVPEPSSLLLFGTGLIGLAGFARRKLSKA